MSTDLHLPPPGTPVAFVLGGGDGIGRASAERLADDGFIVYVGDIRVREGLTSGDIRRIIVDVTSRVAVEEAVQLIYSECGRIDVIVYSAGVPALPATLWEVPESHWREVFEVHVFGLLNVLRTALPSMVDAAYGRIVNVASMAGKEGNVNAAAYSAAKGAVIALTKSVGKELAKTGVLVNAVTPALISTDFVKGFTSERRARLLEKIPMGRAGTPAEAAELIAFLASPRASFSTGAVFDLSGGRATY